VREILILFLSGSLMAIAGCSGNAQKAGDPDPPPERKSSGVVIIPPDSPKLQQIRVEPVKTAEVPTDEIVTPGKVETNPNRVSRTLLPVPGRIGSVLVKLGDAVIAGQPLLTIESPDADQAMSAYLQAGASSTQAQAALLKAQADHDRAKDLYEHSAIAKKEVLNAENALAQTKAGLQQAQASREQTQRRLELLGLKPGDFGQKVVVKAPLNGKILELTVAAGEYHNDTNASVMTIADLSTVWIAADVSESYIRFIQLGERVDIELAAYPGETFRGRVARIADTVDPQTRTVKVRAEMDNARGRLRPEMFGRIRHTESTKSLPAVPAGAMIQGDGKSMVFSERSRGVFEQVQVTPGKRMGDLIAIQSGLKEGDRIVVDGAMLLKGY